MTKREILKLNGMYGEQLENCPNLFFAMDEYAEQVAKDYVTWLAHEVTAGRTANQLWNDYQNSKR